MPRSGRRSSNLTEIDDVTVRRARNSSFAVAGVLALLSAWQLYRGRPTAAEVLVAVVVALLVCSTIPAAAVMFHTWWMRLAGLLGFVNSRILLSALFFFVMSPIGLLVRLTGHDPLERRRGHQKSYWRARALTRQPREGYERSF
jgi:Saxitoxin biosynthesis operon protein SxtJ